MGTPADSSAGISSIGAEEAEESSICRPKDDGRPSGCGGSFSGRVQSGLGEVEYHCMETDCHCHCPSVLRDKFGFEDEGSLGISDEFDEDNHEGDSVGDLQSGHGTRIAGLIYARLVPEGQFETKSQEWHQFLGFASSQAGFGVKVGQKRKQSHWDQANREMRLYR